VKWHSPLAGCARLRRFLNVRAGLDESVRCGLKAALCPPRDVVQVMSQHNLGGRKGCEASRTRRKYVVRLCPRVMDCVSHCLQLPPVVSDPEVAQYYTDRYRSPYFFSADVFRETELVPIELTKVFRQSGQEFVDMLDRIRLNDSHRDAVAKINRDCYRDKEPNSAPALFLVPTNAAAKSINTQNLEDLQAPLMVFDAILEGRFDVQRDRFQAPHRLEIKEGAQILFVKNNKPYWVNGTLGRIVQI